MNIIKINQLLKKYDNYTALNSVDFSTRTENIHRLLGPNGPRKSAFIIILNEILYFDRARITFNWNDVATFSSKKIEYLREKQWIYKHGTIKCKLLNSNKLEGSIKKRTGITKNISHRKNSQIIEIFLSSTCANKFVFEEISGIGLLGLTLFVAWI